MVRRADVTCGAPQKMPAAICGNADPTIEFERPGPFSAKRDSSNLDAGIPRTVSDSGGTLRERRPGPLWRNTTVRRLPSRRMPESLSALDRPARPVCRRAGAPGCAATVAAAPGADQGVGRDPLQARPTRPKRDHGCREQTSVADNRPLTPEGEELRHGHETRGCGGTRLRRR